MSIEQIMRFASYGLIGADAVPQPTGTRRFDTYQVFHTMESESYCRASTINLDDYKMLGAYEIPETITDGMIDGTHDDPDCNFLHIAKFPCVYPTAFDQVRIQLWSSAGDFYADKVIFLVLEKNAAGEIVKWSTASKKFDATDTTNEFSNQDMSGWTVPEGSLNVYLCAWESGSDLSLDTVCVTVRTIL